MQETNLTDWIYMRDSIIVWGMATSEPSTHRGSIAVFYCKSEHFAIEDIGLHGPNVISFQLVKGRRRWNIVGCYIAPSDASTIENVVAVIRARPYGAKLLVGVDINTNLEETEGTLWSEAIMEKLMAAGLVVMGLHFLPRLNPWSKYRFTWRMQQDRQ